MIKKLLFICFSFFQLSIFGQIEMPEDKVDWKFYIDYKDNCEAFVVAKLVMVEHWHINALKLPPDNFGYATVFKIQESPKLQILGQVLEPTPITKFDEESEETLSYHEGTIYLKQKIEIKSIDDFKLKLTFSYQPCDSVKCLLPFEEDFEVNVKGCTAENETIEVQPQDSVVIDSLVQTLNLDSVAMDSVNNLNANSNSNVENNNESETKEKGSLFTIFILSFLSGFAALLTPCVFPMIPMTVSYFTKTSKSKSQGIQNALLYGISIIVIYILLGTIVTAVFGAETLNNMSTNPTFNIIFFVLLVVFAISFMGAFEIRMPNSWINKADQRADKGGVVGIFFMALALALVSFSCTGPIVGSLLVQAASEGGIAPFVGMFGFSFALALPFALFAMFPGWMNSLPQSGGWLNSVKVVLGVLELALAFKFLSNADLSLQTHYLERELFLAIWIAIFTFLTLYLFGFILLPHDSKVEKISVGRSILGILSFVFVIYMIPGLWGAPLKLISAFPPPLSYSESPLGVGGSGSNANLNHEEGMHLGPQNIMVFHDYDIAFEYAKKVNKPLFVDFTGHNCVNCRKMEQSVWGEPVIIDYLKNDVVIVSLHVDEKVALPINEQETVTMPNGKQKVLKTTGDKWMFMQISKYQIAAQPYYRMIDNEGKELNNGSADYENHRDVSKFKSWLEAGLEEFKSR
jgi:thiol:disulfide interchange protein